jgi:hypothetical protein
MNEIKKEVEEEKEKINNEKNKTPKKSTKKIKKKKKVKKKKPVKEYKNLKELLDDINKEKEEKLLKEKKLKEKDDKKKEKEEEIQIKENINITNSISGTTTGTLSLDDFMPNYLLINNNDTNDNSEKDLNEEGFFKKRKMSSPIFDYYNGYDKFFSQEKESSIDLKNSVNFVEKNKFISSCELNLSKLNINPKESDVKDKNVNNNNNNLFNENDNNYINYNNNIYTNEEINYMNYYYDYYVNPKFGGTNDIQNIINNINNNIASSYYSVPFSYNNKKPKKKFERMNKSRIKKGNNIRIGDWTCSYCYNLNFSFRKTCNRCNTPKQVL